MLIDISPSIDEKSAVYPGDTPYQRQISMSWTADDHLALSAIKTTVHIGAHADAPLHYHPNGTSIDVRDLNLYYGPCQVIETLATEQNEILIPSRIANIPLQAPRILFKTNSFNDRTHWHDNFTALSPELIDYLAEHQVQLVGIDTPSVDPAQAKILASHQAIYKNDMAILEGLTLKDVAAGLYTLIALPLKLANADAAPVRAALVP